MAAQAPVAPVNQGQSVSLVRFPDSDQIDFLVESSLQGNINPNGLRQFDPYIRRTALNGMLNNFNLARNQNDEGLAELNITRAQLDRLKRNIMRLGGRRDLFILRFYPDLEEALDLAITRIINPEPIEEEDGGDDGDDGDDGDGGDDGDDGDDGDEAPAPEAPAPAPNKRKRDEDPSSSSSSSSFVGSGRIHTSMFDWFR